MEVGLRSSFRMFKKSYRNVIGMIHLSANPGNLCRSQLSKRIILCEWINVNSASITGTPKCQGSVSAMIKKAKREAEIYQQAGVDSVIIENMNDIPYLPGAEVGPEIVAAMTMVSATVRQTLQDLPIGIQILAGANQQAMAVAHAAGLDYIRAEGFIFSHVADEGLMNACAGQLLRYRKQIGAESIKIYTDIKKKHSSHAITSDVSLSEMAHAAEFFLSDGVIVTGTATGQPADVQDLEEMKSAVSIPVFIGSGVTASNFRHYRSADGLIIGSYFKKGHHWTADIDEKVLTDFMDLVKSDED